MQRVFFIYKICCFDPEITDEYIGLTVNFNKTIYDNKYRVNDENCTSYDSKLFQTIRANGGWDNWLKFPIEIMVTDDVVTARKRQTELMHINNTSLNMKNSYTSLEDVKLKNSETIQCYCGGHYSRIGQSRHFKTATHILNDPVYTKHRRENLFHYQLIDTMALRDPSLVTPYIALCWKLRDDRLKLKSK